MDEAHEGQEQERGRERERLGYCICHYCDIPTTAPIGTRSMLSFDLFYVSTIGPSSTAMSNIWVAAGDGDLARVQVSGRKIWERGITVCNLSPQHLVETQSTNVLASMTYRLIDDIGISPNQPDAHTYTPMYAVSPEYTELMLTQNACLN